MLQRCIVIDDDLDAIEEINEYITNTPELKLVKAFSNSIEALNYIKENGMFNLIFMDVDMPKMNGIELSGIIRNQTEKLIFTTSHAKYALDAFDVEADAFLLKPFNYSKFFSVVSKFIKPREYHQNTEEDYLYVKNKSEDLKMVKVRFADIVAIESLANYIKIYTIDSNIITHLKLKEAKEIFNKYNNFMQLHRSFLISKNHINSIEGNTLTMSNGSKFTIGEIFRKTLSNFLIEKTLRTIQNK